MTATSVLRVVVADDTPDIRQLLRFALERQGGFRVVGEAANGVEAVELARVSQPDAVLLDLAMPKMDGLEAIPAILQECPGTKIVVLSGFESSVMANEALDRGAHAYLPKGTMPAGIASKVREVCGVPGPGPSRPSAPGRRTRRSASDMMSALVHELRNQATVVEGFARMLSHDWDYMSDEQRRDSLDRILRNASQIRALVDAFGDASRMGTAALELSMQSTALAPLTREIVDDLAVMTNRRVELLVERDAWVRVDPIRMRQVLTNLLSNAAKFSPAHRPITVTVRAENAHAVVAVRDHGRGIPAEGRAELFKPFARLGAREPGSGLGLYISRGIVRAHGGELELAEADGGACFVVRLPIDA
jgi:signal transduction histidine kinase